MNTNRLQSIGWMPMTGRQMRTTNHSDHEVVHGGSKPTLEIAAGYVVEHGLVLRTVTPGIVFAGLEDMASLLLLLLLLLLLQLLHADGSRELVGEAGVGRRLRVASGQRASKNCGGTVAWLRGELVKTWAPEKLLPTHLVTVVMQLFV